MSIVEGVVASKFSSDLIATHEDVSIVIISSDNKSFSLNVTSSKEGRTDGQLPGSTILTEQPLPNYRTICRIVSEEKFGSEMLKGRCRIISNSLEDKLKSYAIIKFLNNCM